LVWPVSSNAVATAAAATAFEDTGQTNDSIATNDSRIVCWASGYSDFVPGRVDYNDPESALANFGHPDSAVGPIANGSVYGVVSLGDSGYITLTFDSVIANGTGPDIVVFENGFASGDGLFAELAFVEVSSNGVDFQRIPCICRNDAHVGGFGVIDPTQYYNFCGITTAGNTGSPYGTAIDLEDAVDEPLVVNGTVDLDSITHVRLVDVIGSGLTTDFFGDSVFDPYPTPFNTGGCDVNGVAVLNVRSGAVPVARTDDGVHGRDGFSYSCDRHGAIRVSIANAGRGGYPDVRLFSLDGREVAVSVDRWRRADCTEYLLSPGTRAHRGFAPGIYTCKVRCGDRSDAATVKVGWR